MQLDPLSIVLTNFCNQNCSFCFARDEMARSLKKEMSQQQFELILDKCNKAKINLVYLLGGEPTLHSKFPEFLDLAAQKILFIRIFTNGIFTDRVKKAIIKLGRRTHLIVNISTPGFGFNQGISDLVLKNISEMADQIHISLSITDLFFSDREVKRLLDKVNKYSPVLLKKVGIKLGFIMPIAGDKNLITINEFPKVGKNVVSLVKYIDQLGPAKDFGFNSGFVPCMFTASERKFLKKYDIRFRVSCHPEGDLFHVTSSAGALSSYKCYPLNSCEDYKIEENTDFNDIKSFFHKIHNQQIRKFVLDKCKTCPFFGYSKGKCSGPCLPFRMNALRGQEQLN